MPHGQLTVRQHLFPGPWEIIDAFDVSELVQRAARRGAVLHAAWSRDTHELYPDAARARAVELLRLSQQLAIQPRFTGEEQAVVDVWITHVIPQVLRHAGVESKDA